MAAIPLLLPVLQQAITGLFNFLMSFIFDSITCKGMFLEFLICPPANSSYVLTSIITAPFSINVDVQIEK
jgi:hypothetical protein